MKWMASFPSQRCKHQSNVRKLFKANNKDTRTPSEHRQWRGSGIFIVNLSRFHSLSWYFHCWLWKSKCQLGFVSILSSIPQHLKSSEILRTIYVKWVQLNQSNSHIATKIYRFHLTFVTINKPHNQSDLNSQKNSNFLFQVLQVSVKLIHTKSWW